MILNQNTYYLTLERTGGYVGEEATVFLDWDFHDELYWDYSENNETKPDYLDMRFIDSQYPNSVVFSPNISEVKLAIEVYANEYADDNQEWFKVSARDQISSPGYFSAMPQPIELKLVEYIPQTSKGWMWFGQFPWVYSDEEKNWTFFYVTGSSLMVYSVKNGSWREIK